MNDVGTTIRSSALLYKSSCICVLRWYVCAESDPAKSSMSESDLHICMWSERWKPVHFMLIYRRTFICSLHLILGLQWRLKEDVTLQTITVSQLITTVKAAASLSWHLKPVWITHTMSDRQIACAPQSVLLSFQWHSMEPSWIRITLSVWVCQHFLHASYIDIILLFTFY